MTEALWGRHVKPMKSEPMPSIQARAYPVSVVVQSQIPAAPRNNADAPSAAKPSANPATVSAEVSGVSNRVNAYLSTERTNTARQEQRSSDNQASDRQAADRRAVEFDEAKNYKPNSMY